MRGTQGSSTAGKSLSSMRLSRGTLVALLLAVVATATVFAQVTPGGYVPTPQTDCYRCHKPGLWTPPLKQFGGIQPPETTATPLATEFPYAVKFRALWTPRGNDPTLVNASVRLDLSNAPSLSFGGTLPDLDNKTELDMRLDPASGSVTVTRSDKVRVPSGTTQLRIEAVPFTQSLQPPDIRMTIAPGGTADPIEVDEASHGQAEVREFTYDELALLPDGEWTVTVSFDAVAAGDTPVFATDVRVDVVSHASFDLQRIRQLKLDMVPQVLAGQIIIKTWPLIFTAEPGPGENITISYQGVAHYKHKQAGDSSDDWDFIDSLVVPVAKDGDNVALVYQSQAFAPEILNGPTLTTVSEAVGYASAFLLISSIWSGGMFGMASRRQLNRVFVSAKRRVAFHNFLSYGLMLGALAHTILFVFFDREAKWTVGMIWGNLSILGMAGLGVTGALQVQLIKRWGYGGWRWTHYGMAVGAILFTIVHMLLDGVNFAAVQQAVGWQDPFASAPDFPSA